MSIDGVNIPNYPAGGLVVGIPIQPFKQPPASVTGAPGSSGNDIYNAATIRFVAINFRITNTTSILNRQGAYAAFHNTLTVSDDELTTNSVAAASGFSLRTLPTSTLNIANAVFAPIGTSVRRVEGFVQPTIPSGNVKSGSFARGAINIRLPHIGNQYFECPLSDVPIALVASNMTGTLVPAINLLAGNNGAFSQWFGGLLAYDNHWSGVHLTLDGLNPAGTSFQVETFFTYEITPNNNSAYYALAKDRPKPDQQAMQQASNRRPEFAMEEQMSGLDYYQI